MIYINDYFLKKDVFKKLQNYCYSSEFQLVKTKEKSFLTLPLPKEMLDLFTIDGHKIILSFIRKAHSEFDNDLRIHSDHYILGQKTSVASVLYINKEDITPNGTAFYEHKDYGIKLPENISKNDFDILLSKDSNNPLKWVLKDSISSRPNRLLVYDANYFHGKYPKKIERGERMVLVNFYTKL